MALIDYISRIFGRKPIWLYVVSVGTQSFYLTPKATGFTTGANRPTNDYPAGQAFLASAINRGEIINSTLENRVDVWLRIPTFEPAIQAVLDRDESEKITVEIWQGYIGDPDEEYIRRYVGRVTSIEPSLMLTTLNCEPAITEMVRSSVAQVMQRTCRHSHYFTNADGGGCRLDLSAHQQSAPITNVSGLQVTVPLASAQPDGNYLAGILEYNGIEYTIEDHAGSILTLESEVPGLADDIAIAAALDPPQLVNVLIAQGCNLLSERCVEFNNIENFGGFRWMDETPFDGRSIA